MVYGWVNSGSTPARTSELLPEPLAPTTNTNGRSARACACKASNTSPIARVRPWKIGACSNSKTFSPRKGLAVHRRTFRPKAFGPTSRATRSAVR